MKILDRKVEFSTPWFQVLAKRINADELPFYSLALPDYVCVVPFTPKGNLIVVKQFRPAVEVETWELPSGIHEKNEEPLATAKRELWEETGYLSKEWNFLGPELFTDTGRMNNRLWCFIAKNAQLDPKRKEFPLEPGIVSAELTQAELLREIREQRFVHSLHLAPLLLAAMQGHLKL